MGNKRRSRGDGSGAWARRRLALIASLVVFTLPAPTRAEDQDKAEELARRAIVEQQAGRHEAAIVLFDRSLAELDHPMTRFYKTKSLVALKSWKPAKDLLQTLLEACAQLGPQNCREVMQSLELCDTTLKEVSVSAPVVVPTPVVIPVRPPPDTVVTPIAPPVTPFRKPDGTEAEVPGMSVRRLWAWITLGGAVASLAGGAGLIGHHFAEVNREPPAGYVKEDVAPIGLISGGTLAAVGLGLGVTSTVLFLGDDDAAVRSAWLIPAAQGVAFGVGGTW